MAIVFPTIPSTSAVSQHFDTPSLSHRFAHCYKILALLTLSKIQLGPHSTFHSVTFSLYLDSIQLWSRYFHISLLLFALIPSISHQSQIGFVLINLSLFSVKYIYLHLLCKVNYFQTFGLWFSLILVDLLSLFHMLTSYILFTTWHCSHILTSWAYQNNSINLWAIAWFVTHYNASLHSITKSKQCHWTSAPSHDLQVSRYLRLL